MGDVSHRGLFGKYSVRRTDGRDDAGGDREDARYFVLDYVHDPYARVALGCYAAAVAEEHPELSGDLLRALSESQGGLLEVPEDCPECRREAPLHFAGCRREPVEFRPSWDAYFLAMAETASLRADCRRAQVGAVIAKDNRVRSTGYNGGPSGGPSCLAGECPRGLMDRAVMPGFEAGNHDYSNCVALHAEVNAIAYADRDDCAGATLYMTKPACDMCEKLVRAAGIRRVVWPEGELTL